MDKETARQDTVNGILLAVFCSICTVCTMLSSPLGIGHIAHTVRVLDNLQNNQFFVS